jgi:glycerophosphoryl diester phosphodiesterase
MSLAASAATDMGKVAGRSSLSWLTARPIAHRGYHDAGAGRLENTAEAFAAAIGHNFAIECDVRLSADESVVVFHDDTLERLTNGAGRIEASSLAVLRGLRLNGVEARIPTLEEVLEQIAGRVPLVVELKSSWNGDRRLERRVADILTGYAGAVAVMSFDPGAMRAMSELAPHLPRGMLGGDFSEAGGYGHIPPLRRFALRHLFGAASVAPQFVAFDVNALPANAPLLLRHVFGMPLLTWTVKTPQQRLTARRWADQMIFETFDPDTVELAAAGA